MSRRITVQRLTSHALAALALVALVAIPARTAGLTPLRERTSDQVIAADLARMDRLALQIGAYSASTETRDRWRIARAEALLEAARHEYMDNDRTGFDTAALAEAEALVAQIGAGAAAFTRDDVPGEPTLAGTTRVREDLWTQLEQMKRHEGYACAAEELARMEVALLRAGNEQVDQGECHTSPHLAEAEHRALAARAALEACLPPAPVVVQPPAPEPIRPSETVPQPAPSVPTAEELRIPRNVHFALDKYAIGVTSRRVIDGIVAVLKRYPSITVRLEGHTDSRASAAYNMRLSQNRVNSVRNVMVALGIDAARITTSFKGEADLRSDEDSKTGFARNRRVEMVFVDSEGRDIQAEPQEEDLQLESDREFGRSKPDPKK